MLGYELLARLTFKTSDRELSKDIVLVGDGWWSNRSVVVFGNMPKRTPSKTTTATARLQETVEDYVKRLANGDPARPSIIVGTYDGRNTYALFEAGTMRGWFRAGDVKAIASRGRGPVSFKMCPLCAGIPGVTLGVYRGEKLCGFLSSQRDTPTLALDGWDFRIELKEE